MKLNLSILSFVGIIGLFSCTENEVPVDLESNQQTRSIASSDLSSTNDSIISEVFTNQELKQHMRKNRMLSSYPSGDEYFSSNMYAIRELPFRLKARGWANTSNQYLTASKGAGQNLILGTEYRRPNDAFLYYFKVMPLTGQYFIYSKYTGTPLSVGSYKSNPNNKVVYITKANEKSDMDEWDLIPSSYRGYFGMKNEFYLGQTDPNNMWSVFNYYVEIKNDDQVGFAQYKMTPQQDFLIDLIDNFDIDTIVFDESSAEIKEKSFKLVKSGINPSVNDATIKYIFSATVNPTSYFKENGNLIVPHNFNKKNYLPTVLASTYFPPQSLATSGGEDMSYFTPVSYSTKDETLSKAFRDTIMHKTPPKSLVRLTVTYRYYHLKVNYIVTMKYKVPRETGNRVVKFNGIWEGDIYNVERLDNGIPEVTPLNSSVLKLINEKKIDLATTKVLK